MKILIVEDEGIIAVSTKISLMRLGYDVLPIAISGKTAIALSNQLRPDLILMDIRLSGPMDGIEAVKQIKSNLDVPVIFVTAHSDDKIRERAMDTRPAGFLLKPVSDSHWDPAIKKALKNPEKPSS